MRWILRLLWCFLSGLCSFEEIKFGWEFSTCLFKTINDVGKYLESYYSTELSFYVNTLIESKSQSLSIPTFLFVETIKSRRNRVWSRVLNMLGWDIQWFGQFLKASCLHNCHFINGNTFIESKSQSLLIPTIFCGDLKVLRR